MKLEIELDERNKLRIEEWPSDALNFQIWQHLNGIWELTGGVVLTNRQAVSLGIALINKGGGDSVLMKKYRGEE
jgi:hypothetical protein